MNYPMELIALVISSILTLFKSFKFIQEGEQGIKLTFGKANRDRNNKPVIIQPGFAFLIPWVQSLKRHHVRQQTHRLNYQSITLADGLIYNVSAIVIFKVSDIYKALFEIEQLDQSLVDLSMGVLREVLSAKRHNELQNMRSISSELLEQLRDRTDQWGVELIQFNLTDCAPSKESAPLVTVEAGVRLRLAALKSATKDGNIDSMTDILAATLVGMPLVASVTNAVSKPNYVSPEQSGKNGRGFVHNLLTAMTKDDGPTV